MFYCVRIFFFVYLENSQYNPTDAHCEAVPPEQHSLPELSPKNPFFPYEKP